MASLDAEKEGHTSNLPQDTDDEKTEVEARELRIALDELFERKVRILSQEEGEVIPFEEQFILLVSEYSEDALKRAVLLTTEDDPDSPSFSGRLPIHLACDKNAPLQVIQWLLDSDAEKRSILRKDKWGDLPIHTACSRKDSIDVIKLLLDGDAEKVTILTKDHHHALPLHYAVRYNAPPEVVRLLLDSDAEKNSLFEEGLHGQLPLHVACRCNSPPAVFRLLLDCDLEKKTVLEADNVGRLPIHVFLLRNYDADVVRMLLEAMIHGRLERLGLEQWKRDVRRFLRGLATHERDLVARDKLDAIRDALGELMERAILLELAVWKASCLAFADGVHADLDPKHHAVNSCEYRKERRIKSGAEVIIPHVLPFLEDEPVIELVQELK